MTNVGQVQPSQKTREASNQRSSLTSKNTVKDESLVDKEIFCFSLATDMVEASKPVTSDMIAKGLHAIKRLPMSRRRRETVCLSAAEVEYVVATDATEDFI